MSGASKKRRAEEMEPAPAAAPAAGAPPEASVKDLFLELSGKNDGIERIRADFQESLAQQSEQHARCMERLRRDQEAGDSGNKWHKGINIQLDLHEDAGRFLKRAEDRISRIRLAMPTALARELLLEGKKIGLDDFEPMGLKVFPVIKDVVSDLDNTSSLLAKRSQELTVVRNAPSAKVGYRTLDIMANAGNLSPGADKALKEAIRVVEEEERETRKKKEAGEKRQQQQQHQKPWAVRPDRQQGGWGARESYPPPESSRGGWGDDRQSRSNHSSPAQARPGSQGMPYSGGKGGGGKGNEGMCNACGEYGHWARDCKLRRFGW